MTTVREALADASARLQAVSDSPRVDADCLLQHLLQQDRSWLRLHADAVLEPALLADFEQALARRLQGEPVAYITGERGFWSLDLQVGPATLIPRPDTELLVEWALELLPRNDVARVLDLGTGSGAIALAVKQERPGCEVVAVDASAAALALAAANAARLQLDITFLHSDWFTALAGQRFDLILGNPPYIAEDDPHLVQGDLRFEPHSALVAADAGLSDLSRIINAAPEYLAPGGWLLLEHGYEQGEAVRELLNRQGFEAIATRRDFGGNERSSGGRWPC
jgi:release factor glutamine methyltransferase